MVDPDFYKTLAAMGELTIRKQRQRRRIYILVGLVVFPPIVLGGLLALGSIGFYFGLACAGAITLGIAEGRARSQLPRLIEEVARDKGVSVEQLRADAKHVESGGVK